MFFVLGESGYTGSNWYKQILDGMLTQKRTKRFNIVIIDNINETDNFTLSPDDAILLIGSNYDWLESVIDFCVERFSKNVIVLGNFERQLSGRSYSIVSADISADVCNLYAYLLSHNKKKIAMYGINPQSASDRYRKNSFLECGGNQRDVYENNANLCKCFEKFVPYVHKYDAVLCANDYCAISLMLHMKNENIPSIFVASCGETKLARLFKPDITNLETSYKDFGRAAINVYKTLQKDFPVSSVKIKLASSIIPGKSTDKLPVLKYPLFTSAPTSMPDDSFYRDGEVAEMLGIESVLSHCDKAEIEMLFSLIDGMTYTNIAEKYHLSVNGVKYRLNKLFKLCGAKSKSEFTALLEKYIKY